MNGDISEESSEYDLYATLMLSNMLDTEHDINEKKEEESPTLQEETNHDVIWVPADKHPEIAPKEFANFIKTHGANTPTRKAFSLHRRRSILSQSLISTTGSSSQHPGLPMDDDEEEKETELNRTMSEKKRIFLQKVMTENQQLKDETKKTQVFDRNSTANDDSSVIAPKKPRSLLRRSAFSARGRSRKANGTVDDRQQEKKRRSVSERKSSSSTVSSLNDKNNNNNTDIVSVKSEATQCSWDKSEGISLFDQPVNMSEWIDLGSASLESDDSQRGILSRVHDAESLLLSHQLADVASNEKNENEHLQHGQSTKTPPPSVQPPTREDVKSLADVDVKKQEKDTETAAEAAAADTTRIAPKLKLEALERPGIIRSETETNNIIPPSIIAATKSEKRSSWLGGLFNDKKNRKSNDKKGPLSVAVINNTALSPLSGFSSLFSRSASNISPSQFGRIKLKNKINNTKATNTVTSTNHGHNLDSTTATTMIDTTKPTRITPPTIITNNTILNNNNNNNNKKKKSSRLEIPPPSERTFFNSNRLPLHLERSIYRLSHMKLANPRRPLQQQVLISNLMFWYLSIQQNDYHHVAEQSIEMGSPPPVLDTQQKKGGKVSRLILSAKKRRNEVAQFVQSYPLSGTHRDISMSSSSTTTTTTSSSSASSSSSSSSSAYALSIESPSASSTTTRPSLKQSNVQFCLPPMPIHHHTINFYGEHDEEEEDDLPLSHFKS